MRDRREERKDGERRKQTWTASTSTQAQLPAAHQHNMTPAAQAAKITSGKAARRVGGQAAGRRKRQGQAQASTADMEKVVKSRAK